jgi:Meckel syndrome type 1 protein
MTMNYNGETDKPITEQEGVMFAATPAWERGKKRRGLGPKKVPRTAAPAAAAPVTPEPRSFAAERDYDEPMALDTPVSRPMDRADQTTAYAMGAAAATPTIGETLEAEDAGLVAPIGRPSARADRSAKSHGVGPAALAAGAVAVIAAGGIGWYAMRGDDGGVPELTPGSTTSEVAAASLPPVDLPPNPPAAGQRASNILPERTTPSAPAAREVARAETRAPARVRPAAAASAETSGTNASATIPSGPQPYSTLNPGATPAPVNPAPAAAPPPVQATPEPIPSTPPVTSTEPSPVNPTTPETATPPETTTPPQ